ncbi:hypothetical protein PTI98_010767 [Pleurotus ostreatus]|uniref:Uncharacterized protein n=1 Tax=Pleurotus cornucopiae TaxID=5321 RepID=A0ACB7JD97_PLECO|nr:hypothetical protein CCMSSC00406_0004175 [Pleurotus cornucopiae]KAJ8691172.1 hypothetical protein PTI98_010767 [Pleurotus ostreatus]
MPQYQSTFVLAILAATLVTGRGANDWSKPCFNGECAYDIPTKGQSASIRLIGAPHAISDITPAAGWVILDCDANSMAQDIRLVCNSDDAEAAGCSHLFDSAGPVHKYVRLPENCGSEPFARVANLRVHENQSIPEHAASKISRRDGTAPQVFAISIDDDFPSIDVTKYGQVLAVAVGTNVAGVDTDFSVPRSIISQVGADQWSAQAVKDVTENAIKTVKAILDPYYAAKPDGEVDVKKLLFWEETDGTRSDGGFKWGSKTRNYTLSWAEDKTLAGCNDLAFTAEINARVDNKAYGSAAFFSAAAVVDLTFSSIKAMASNLVDFSAHFEHHLTLALSLEGTFEKSFTVLEPVAIPDAGVDLKYLAAGLMFGIDGEFHTSARVGLELKTGFKWGIDRAVISIPSTEQSTPYARDGYFDLSISEDEDGNKATGEIGFSITPKLILGAEGKGKLSNVKVSGNVGLRAGAGLTVGVTGPPSGNSDWYCAKLNGFIEGVAGLDFKHPIALIPNWETEYSLFRKDLELFTHGNCPVPKQERRSLAGLLRPRSSIKSLIEQLKNGLLCPKRDISKVTKADAKSGLDSSTMKMKNSK